MPFIIPILAIGAGVGVGVWGVTCIINKDDSADEAAAKFLKSVPSEYKKWITSVELKNGKLEIGFQQDTSKEVKKNLKNNIKKLPEMKAAPKP